MGLCRVGPCLHTLLQKQDIENPKCIIGKNQGISGQKMLSVCSWHRVAALGQDDEVAAAAVLLLLALYSIDPVHY